MHQVVELCQTKFLELFNHKPRVFRSPGRINIIGEHIDYNHGFVLPAAIDKAVYMAIAPNHTQNVSLYSLQFSELFTCTLGQLKPISGGHWANYLLGVVDQLAGIGGFDLVFHADVPAGAGLSSSAAIECATAFALNTLFQLGISKTDLVRIAQKAEHNYAGVQCGIMDMYASMMGQKDMVLKLDCLSETHQYFKVNLPNEEWVFFNSGVKHSLAESAYNNRRKACEQGFAWVQEQFAAVRSFRDVSIDMLHAAVKDPEVYKRCVYVVKEIDRVGQCCTALESGHAESVGQLLYETHAGLSSDYEVSCTELDFLVTECQKQTEVLGARMMGGGFGGCTINLIKKGSLPIVYDKLQAAYRQQFGLPLECYPISLENGTSEIEN